MVEESEPPTPASEPQVLWGSTSPEKMVDMAKRFTESSQSFLDALQTLRGILEGQIQKVVAYASPSFINPFGGFPVLRLWKPPQEFDYSVFTNSASETYEAWRIAKRINHEVAEFDGESLGLMVDLFNKLRYEPISNDGFHEAETIAAAAANFMTAVDRLELLLSVKPPKGETPSPDLPADPGTSVPSVEEPNAVELDAEKSGLLTQHSQRSQSKIGAVSDADREKVQAAIDDYKKNYNGADPTSDTIRKQSGLGPGKISKIMDERRTAGEWAVPKRIRD